MRILYLAPDPVPAPKGASVRITRTVETFRALGHEVDLFTPALTEEENFLARMMAFRRDAARWLDGRTADLVQFRGIWEGIPALAAARRMGAKAVYEAHGFPSIELPYHFPNLAGEGTLLAKIIDEERRLLTGADRVVTPSRTGALYLLRLGVPRERIDVLPNAVDTDLFSPGPVPPDEPPYRLLYEGTLAPWQGLATVLEALVPLRSAPVELHVIGPYRGLWRAEIRRQARALRVHHLVRLSGSMAQADLPPVLRTAHVGLAPLPRDPRNAVQGCCPIKLLEYMAAGRPIVSTRIAPVEEIVEDGVTALLVEPGSPHALSTALRWMLAHPAEREALGAKAREVAVARFGADGFRANVSEALSRLGVR